MSGPGLIRVYVAKPLLRRSRWMGWVKSAADRLETMVFMVSSQDSSGTHLLVDPPRNPIAPVDSA